MTPDQVLEEIENSKEAFMIIGRKKGKVLGDLVEKHKPKHVLEVGTNLGYSSILMGMHLPEGGKITTLEIDAKVAHIAQENINKAGFSDKINIILGDAKEIIPTLPGTFDFMFIDAAKKQYLTYLKLAEGKLAPNAVIAADNVGIFEDAVKDYLTYVRKNYQSQTVQVGEDALEVSNTLQ